MKTGTLALITLLALGTCQAAHAETTASPRVRIALAPTQTQDLSGIAWRALVRECTAIWAREGVDLTWDGAAAGARVLLPVVFDDREVRAQAPKKGGDPFAITQFAGRSQRIVVSVSRARDVIRERRGHADSGDGTTLDIVTGVLLGRVVAHEIGHALLLSMRHAPEGLMRAKFDARDAQPSAGAEFALSASDRERLATRFSNGNEPGQLAAFTWGDVPPVPSLLRARR